MRSYLKIKIKKKNYFNFFHFYYGKCLSLITSSSRAGGWWRGRQTILYYIICRPMSLMSLYSLLVCRMAYLKNAHTHRDVKL